MSEANEVTMQDKPKEKKEKLSNVPVKDGPAGIGKTAWKMWSATFCIDDRYTPIKAIGQGAYGTVCSAKDHVTGRKVAIKKISNCFDHDVDARRTLRECMLLRHLRHENIVGIKELMVPRDREFKDLYIVQDLMDTDLHQIIRSSQPLSNEHHQCFIHQILRGLKYIHSANVLHRDLKPSNLLLTAACDLKICDFGLARTSAEQNMMTEYVVTRWYRAPELLLSCDHYSAAIDVWSVGCILAELLRRKPYFPGKDYMDQLTIIIMQLGMPSAKELSFITNHKARKFISELGKWQKQPFRLEFPDADPNALDLLDRMLQFDPRKRISVEDALNHPYIAPVRGPEPTAPSPFYFAMEDSKLKTPTLRSLVLNEVQCYHPNVNFERVWDAQAAQDEALAKQEEEEAAKQQLAATISLTADARDQNMTPSTVVTS